LDASHHEHRLVVRYAETDQMGVVHHAAYLVYLEESRTRLMRERGCSYAEMERRGCGLPVRKAELRYLAPAFYEQELTVRTRVARVGHASVVFASEVVRTQDGTPLATGSIELACVDLHSEERRLMPLPDDVRQVLLGREPGPAGP
jgi:acyl-CoA thioester hydrolase